jgi:hypothetical protein
MKITEYLIPNHPEAFQKIYSHLKKDINREIDMEICSSIKHNPLSSQDKIKLDQDRKIRAEQEKQYRALENQMAEKKQEAVIDLEAKEPFKNCRVMSEKERVHKWG